MLRKQKIKIKHTYETQILNPKIIESIKQQTNIAGKKSFYIHFALCKGFSPKDEMNAQDFKKLINDFNTYFKDAFIIHIYKSSFGLDHVKEWENANADLINELKEKKLYVYAEEYRKQDELDWNITKSECENLWEKELKDNGSFWIREDSRFFLDRGENAKRYTNDQSEKIIKEETIDVITFAPRADSQDDRLHILLSAKKLFRIMDESIKLLKKLNRKENSLKPIRLRLKSPKNVVNDENVVTDEHDDANSNSNKSSDDEEISQNNSKMSDLASPNKQHNDEENFDTSDDNNAIRKNNSSDKKVCMEEDNSPEGSTIQTTASVMTRLAAQQKFSVNNENIANQIQEAKWIQDSKEFLAELAIISKDPNLVYHLYLKFFPKPEPDPNKTPKAFLDDSPHTAQERQKGKNSNQQNLSLTRAPDGSKSTVRTVFNNTSPKTYVTPTQVQQQEATGQRLN